MRFVFAILFALLLPATAQAADRITGDWISQDGKGVVTIAPCGQAMCGHLTRILPKAKDDPTTDVHNRNPALRSRPLVGLQILFDFKPDDKEWHGTIYYPLEGRTYRAYISRNPDNSLKVRGCWYFICRTIKWTPYNPG
ncbi:MAG: DUF2147 domain-containing protein [Pseudomonadota bacterium]